jgi:hypothetical protein
MLKDYKPLEEAPGIQKSTPFASPRDKRGDNIYKKH